MKSFYQLLIVVFCAVFGLTDAIYHYPKLHEMWMGLGIFAISIAALVVFMWRQSK